MRNLDSRSKLSMVPSNPSPLFLPQLAFLPVRLQVHSRINPSGQLGWERKGSRQSKKYQWYCTPVSTQEAPFMGQQNLGEAWDLISQEGSSSRNKGNHSPAWQSRHSFCVLPEAWAHSLAPSVRVQGAHTHTHTRTHMITGFQKVWKDKRQRQSTWGISQ